MTNLAVDLGPITEPVDPKRGRRVLLAVLRRWPTAVALVLGIDSILGLHDEANTHGLGEALTLLPLLYVVVAVLGRQRASWPVLGVLLAFFVTLRVVDWVAPAVAVLAVALAVAIWGAGHGHHREPAFRWQLAGMAAFGAIAVAGLAVDPDLGRVLVGAGWLAHGVWDFVHLAKNRVVARSYAEWCGVLDVLVGAGLILAPLL